jgi:hypothetical protein
VLGRFALVLNDYIDLTLDQGEASDERDRTSD